MSGFSNAISGISAGLGQGLMAYEKGKDDELKYQELLQKKAQEELLNNQQLTINDQLIKKQQYALQQLADNNMKTRVDITKRDFTKPYMNFIDSLKNAQGKMATITPEGEKVYNPLPQEVTDSVNDLNKFLVYDPDGSNWINHYMDSKYNTLNNPIVKIDYDPTTDEIVMRQKNGNPIKMSPQLMYGALGLDKYSTWREQKLVRDYAAKSEALYKQNKAKAEMIKAKTDQIRAKNATDEVKIKAYEAETNRLKLLNEIKKAKEELKLKLSKQNKEDKLYKLHEVSYKALNTPSITSKDVKPLVDTLMSDKDFADSLTKNNSAYKKVIELKKFSDASKDFLKEVELDPNLLKTGTMQTLNNMWLKLTGTSLPLTKKEEYLKAKDYQTRMKLFIMDYLQYKSGAAFGKEELQGYLDSGGILDFTTPQLALKSLEGMTKYLKQKTVRDIEAVPNANQKLVLAYKSKLIAKENPIVKINKYNQEGNKDALVRYLKELKEKYPISYQAVKQYFKGQ